MPDYVALARAAAISFATAALLIRVFAHAARRVGLVDEPDARKVHVEPVPLVGGLGIFCGIMFALLLADSPLGQYRALIAGSAALLIVGLLDDLHELSPRTRFVAQILAVLLMAGWGEVYLLGFDRLLGPWPLELGWLSIPVTVFAAVGVINAINMVDGLDGLAGSVILICLLGLAVAVDVGAGAGAGHLPLIVVTVAGVGAFLMFNVNRAGGGRVFLGDAGSMSIGFILAWLLIDLSQGPTAVIHPVTALWLLAVPLLDAVFVMVSRMRRSESPFRAGQDHLHHLFLRAGFTANESVAAIAALALVLAALGLVAQWLGLAQYWRFAAFVALSAAYYAVLTRAWTRHRWLGRTVRPVAGCP